jgi:predicted enzyme related to lactoylglutathione lyase
MEVGNLARARWFWSEAIGLAINQDHGAYLQVGGNGGFAIGIEQAPGPVTPDGPEICVRVADVDTLASRLRDLGVTITEEPADMPWGSRNCWLLDPDGRRITIYSSAEPIVGSG